jgi:DNA end-binding protein Ku
MASISRAYWKGFLRLSLVSIAVEIHNAVDTASEVKFNQIHKPSGKRINYTKTVKGIGPVESADIVKAYEVTPDTYITIDSEELDAIKLESKKTMDLQVFVDAKDIDPRYFEQPYYITPADEHAVEGYLVIREALKKENKIGVGQVTMSGREHIVAVGPLDRGLAMYKIRYANELKKPASYFRELPDERPDPEMVELATEIIGRKAAAFKPEQFTDHYVEALKQVIAQKAKGKKIVAEQPVEQPAGNVVNLMDALKKSLAAGGNGKAKSGQGKPTPVKPAPKEKHSSAPGKKTGTRR